jgi:hypothetical protein
MEYLLNYLYSVILIIVGVFVAYNFQTGNNTIWTSFFFSLAL